VRHASREAESVQRGEQAWRGEGEGGCWDCAWLQGLRAWRRRTWANQGASDRTAGGVVPGREAAGVLEVDEFGRQG